MTDQPKLSVVVATYNRADTLREVLRHLMDQDLDPTLYEIVISDDGSPDHTREIVRQAQAISPVPINYLYHPNSGIGYTQNCGIRGANAPVILLMADDIFMSRSALRAHLEMHQANPEPEVAVLGNVQQSPALRSSVFLKTWDLFRFSDFEGKTELPYYRFWACNISVKRDFILRSGGFRENLGRCGPEAHEDVEVGYRLHQRGLRVLYCREALADHHHITTLKQACKKAFSLGVNFGEFCSLVPEPEIPVTYRVLQRETIKDHLQAWFGPRRKYLAATDRNPLIVFSRYALRKLVYNGLTARLWWEPLFERAERDPKIAHLMRPAFYRGLINYYFLLGCAEGNKRFGPARPSEPGTMQIAS